MTVHLKNLMAMTNYNDVMNWLTGDRGIVGKDKIIGTMARQDFKTNTVGFKNLLYKLQKHMQRVK